MAAAASSTIAVAAAVTAATAAAFRFISRALLFSSVLAVWAAASTMLSLSVAVPASARGGWRAVAVGTLVTAVTPTFAHSKERGKGKEKGTVLSDTPRGFTARGGQQTYNCVLRVCVVRRGASTSTDEDEP